ncbi:hypothetical protein [Furfurilactobacillus entadae]|uniref:hypothetical protein n=1 Tax=Furfurilactobacillus entadae TaxID=2922307 RepID=UPI0035E989ED
MAKFIIIDQCLNQAVCDATGGPLLFNDARSAKRWLTDHTGGYSDNRYYFHREKPSMQVFDHAMRIGRVLV